MGVLQLQNVQPQHKLIKAMNTWILNNHLKQKHYPTLQVFTCASKIPTNWPIFSHLKATIFSSSHPGNLSPIPGSPHPTSLRAGSFRAWSNHCRTNLSTWNDVTRPPWGKPPFHPTGGEMSPRRRRQPTAWRIILGDVKVVGSSQDVT